VGRRAQRCKVGLKRRQKRRSGGGSSGLLLLFFFAVGLLLLPLLLLVFLSSGRGRGGRGRGGGRGGCGFVALVEAGIKAMARVQNALGAVQPRMQVLRPYLLPLPRPLPLRLCPTATTTHCRGGGRGSRGFCRRRSCSDKRMRRRRRSRGGGWCGGGGGGGRGQQRLSLRQRQVRREPHRLVLLHFLCHHLLFILCHPLLCPAALLQLLLGFNVLELCHQLLPIAQPKVRVPRSEPLLFPALCVPHNPCRL
jgi:hypothetical protein